MISTTEMFSERYKWNHQRTDRQREIVYVERERERSLDIPTSEKCFRCISPHRRSRSRWKCLLGILIININFILPFSLLFAVISPRAFWLIKMSIGCLRVILCLVSYQQMTLQNISWAGRYLREFDELENQQSLKVLSCQNVLIVETRLLKKLYGSFHSRRDYLFQMV